MSVSFHGLTSSLDINNGLASRLLTAMEYKVGESSDGKMTIAVARKGIRKARETMEARLRNAAYRKPEPGGTILMDIAKTYEVADDYTYLWCLHDLIEELADAGRVHLEWS